ncbi:MAG: hypothetical protein MI861_12740 [Pirellulales bacterium]|nr:hypothetical protein [Pirellulales bacterium]
MIDSRQDPVAARLAAAGNDLSADVLQWLELRRQHDRMDRRATWSSVSGWLLTTLAAVVSSFVAVMVSRSAKQFWDQNWMQYRDIPASMTYVPIVLAAAAGLLLLGGLVGWLANRFPGLRATRAAIDWSLTSDAMTRLLAVGCTYPEAFRTAAKVTRTRINRRWFQSAARRVEHGGSEIPKTISTGRELAIIELLIDHSSPEPSRQWRLASEHFYQLAQRRLELLIGAAPVLSMVVSGLLIWLSVAASSGWMWHAAEQLISVF